MPELRQDPILERWVIMVPGRTKRPTDLKTNTTPKQPSNSSCPFDVGQEHRTPPEVFAIRDLKTAPNTPGWSQRVVPNLFPAVETKGDFLKEENKFYKKASAIGCHEVIIETPEHHLELSELTETEVLQTLLTFQQRFLHHKKNKIIRHIHVFKNQGDGSGASLEHPHSQLIGIPFVPRTIQNEWDSSQKYHQENKTCLYCKILLEEKIAKQRLVLQNEDAISFCPYASIRPFQIWVLPQKHHSHFEETPEDELQKIAKILKQTLALLNKSLSSPSYNLMLHTGPSQKQTNDFYHWHIDILPLTTSIGGFERGTDCYINTVPPENAAEILRNA